MNGNGKELLALYCDLMHSQGENIVREMSTIQVSVPTMKVDRGQTREICKKQGNYFKGKVVTFTVQTLLLYQYPADLLTFLELY